MSSKGGVAPAWIAGVQTAWMRAGNNSTQMDRYIRVHWIPAIHAGMTAI
ncbi:MAG: hypothetical protein KGZ88_16160 [Methylomicrobium sp.]|nr:hypothetical protein [Methylomicrobium sp.]